MDPNGSIHWDNDTLWFASLCRDNMDNNLRRVLLFLLHLLLFMVGLVANSVVLWVNWGQWRSPSGVMHSLLHLCVSDLMVLLVLPFFMLEMVMDHVWVWGLFLCKVTHFIYTVNIYSTSFFLACMTLDRYRALSQPNSIRQWNLAEERCRWLKSACLWLLAVFLALLENVHVTVLDWVEPGCYTVPEYSFVQWYASFTFICLLFQFLGPAAIIITCNLLMARAATLTGGQRHHKVWLMHIYSLVFLLCWFPLHLVMVLMTVDDLNPYIFNCDAIEMIYYMQSVVQGISLFHCVANPILYNFSSGSFRARLRTSVARCITGHNIPNSTTRGTAAVNKEQEVSSASLSTVEP